jgi:Lon protease-like protein
MDLRLFPLQTVLFPGMRMPLHIFEERYKLMIRECIEEDAPFGVVLIRAGAEVGGGAVPYNTGVTARIAQVEYLEDGRMNLFTIGEQRFRINTLYTDREFLRGDIDIIEQEPASASAFEAMPRASELFNEYLKIYLALSDQFTRGVGLPDDPGEAADYIATRTEAPPETKQQWLEELMPDRRLTSELEMIAASLPDMRVRLAIRMRQKTSGFAVLN